jgi:hypothetical protein
MHMSIPDDWHCAVATRNHTLTTKITPETPTHQAFQPYSLGFPNELSSKIKRSPL